MNCPKCNKEFSTSRRAVKKNSTIVVEDIIRFATADSELLFCTQHKIYAIPTEEESKWVKITPKQPDPVKDESN